MPGQKRPSTGRGILRACVRRASGTLALSMASAIARQLAFLAMPYLLGRAVDEGLAAGDGRALGWWLGWFLTAVVVEAVGVTGWMWWSNLAESRLAAGLRSDLLDAVLHAEDGDQMATGDVVARAMDDVDRILIWIHGLTTWVVIAVTVVVLVPAIASMDLRLLGVVLVCVVVMALTSLLIPRMLGPRLAALAQAQGARSQIVQQLLAALSSLRGVGGERALVDRHLISSRLVTDRLRAAAKVRAHWDALGDGLPVIGVGVGLAVAAGPALAGDLDIGQLTTFALWMGTVQVATNAFVARLGDRSEAVAGAHRIASLLSSRSASCQPSLSRGTPQHGARQATQPSRAAPIVQPARLHVAGLITQGSAQTSQAVCVDVGEWVALTGPTGSGKSTLLLELAGRRRPGSPRRTGSVLIGGTDLGSICPDDLPSWVRLVGQGATLLHGTVRDNLLLGCGPLGVPEPDDAALWELCRITVFDRVLDELPAGLDSVVGERGSTLSGGERQRLALARALVRPTPVLLLDDVSSSLDHETEAVLLSRLRSHTADRVVVWATHRPAVQDGVDRVLALSGFSAVAP